MIYFYQRPWVRATPYFVGILFGILYFEYKKELKQAKSLGNDEGYRGSCIYRMFNIATNSTFMTWAYALVGFGITFLCVFVDYSYQKNLTTGWTLTERSIYNMLVRGGFVWGICMVLIPILAGRLTMLAQFLGNSLFHVMAKSTYAVYLIHEEFLNVFILSQKSVPYFTHADAIVICLSMICLSYLVGSLITLLVDSPLGNIDKVFLFPPKKKQQ